MYYVYLKAAPKIHDFLKPLSLKTKKEVMSSLEKQYPELYEMVAARDKNRRKNKTLYVSIILCSAYLLKNKLFISDVQAL